MARSGRIGITLRLSKPMIICIGALRIIDLNMMRAGVVKHPRERENSGYREIQKPPSRYGIIDLLELNALFVGGERMAPVAYDKELTARM